MLDFNMLAESREKHIISFTINTLLSLLLAYAVGQIYICGYSLNLFAVLLVSYYMLMLFYSNIRICLRLSTENQICLETNNKILPKFDFGLLIRIKFVVLTR